MSTAAFDERDGFTVPGSTEEVGRSLPDFPDVFVVARGPIPELEIERVAGAVGRLLARHHVNGGARVKITGTLRHDESILVQVNLRVRGTSARIQTPTPGAGLVLPAVLRLEALIKRLSEDPWKSPWPDAPRPALASTRSGAISRRKNYLIDTSDPDTAAAFMDAMDYDAHLFTDATTGQDAIVYRTTGRHIGMTRQAPTTAPVATPKLRLIMDPALAPLLPEAQAIDRLCGDGLPYLFYTAPDNGRGRLLYRRYDTDLGLITPVETMQANGATQADANAHNACPQAS